MFDLPEKVHVLLMGEVRDQLVETLADKPQIKSRVHFLGIRDDAPAILGSCDLAVAPSRGREGLTKSIIEPMAQGVPAVVTEAGGLPEMVEDGVSGFVVPIDDPKAMARAIKKLAGNRELCQRFGQKARERMLNLFSIEQTVEDTLNLYINVCKDKKVF
jgi:glycosyltransferase involved in cell wall biosynthesis